MSREFLGLSEINGPLVVMENVPKVGFDEVVELKLDDGSIRTGRVVQIEGTRVVVQVFEGTRGLSLKNTRTRMLEHPMEMPVSPELLGRDRKSVV